MKWNGHWSGTTLIAETEEDKGLLRKLYEVLPKHTPDYYDDGDLTMTDTEDETSLYFAR